jgi:hypothetical protein
MERVEGSETLGMERDYGGGRSERYAGLLWIFYIGWRETGECYYGAWRRCQSVRASGKFPNP